LSRVKSRQITPTKEAKGLMSTISNSIRRKITIFGGKRKTLTGGYSSPVSAPSDTESSQVNLSPPNKLPKAVLKIKTKRKSGSVSNDSDEEFFMPDKCLEEGVKHTNPKLMNLPARGENTPKAVNKRKSVVSFKT
jgi:hypothetical protein